MSEHEPVERPPLVTIGDYCNALKADVRDLLIEGYTWKQIDQVARGPMTLEELLATRPAGKKQTYKPRSTKRSGLSHFAAPRTPADPRVANWIVAQILKGGKVLRGFIGSSAPDDHDD